MSKTFDSKLKQTIREITGGVFTGMSRLFPVAARNDAYLKSACGNRGQLVKIKDGPGAEMPLALAWTFPKNHDV